MLRAFMMGSIAAAVLSAFSLYAITYQTRQIAVANQQTLNEINRAKRDIAILRAERAYLMRPDRLEPLARKLGMRPIEGRQYIKRSELLAAKRSQ